MTRSKRKLLLKNGITKYCRVAIRPNYEALCRQYLGDTNGSNAVNSTDNNNGTDGTNIDHFGISGNKPGRVTSRRVTISGTNLFNVDGNVQSFGSNDCVPGVPGVPAIPANVARASHIAKWAPQPNKFIDPFRRTTGGFQIYGRRRSVCVLPTIPEDSADSAHEN